MGTCLEGDWDEVMGVIKQCYERMSRDCDRVTCSIKIDARAGHEGRLSTKIEKIESLLGRRLDTDQ